ncbi:ABC transporter six-transmembrane domain-containing protein [Aquihabitans sp. McL0605]|uniref:ABC transporter six-transmembrane domain-containing protein n=1 Tax=Aquihabitans sp. McL0605 TaxID=3415671 RepID=UPI003CE9745C
MWQMLQGYRARVGLSLFLVVAEAAGAVVVPFVLGLALTDYADGSNRGLILLAATGLVTMVFATVRRLHDVRLYSQIYQRAGETAFAQEAGLSEKTARLNMLREVVDFLEHSMPALVGSISGYIGTLVFLALLSVPVLIGALVMSALIVLIYAASSRRTVAFNRGYNDEYERQVDVLGRNDSTLTRRHIGLMNSWTIKLSDVDTINFALSLTLTVALQVFAIVSSTRQGMDEGTLLSVVLYVFEVSAAASYLPASWQEYLRLRDILQRLNNQTSVAATS